MSNNLDMLIEDMGLPFRAYLRLHIMGCETVNDVTQKTERELLQCRNFGKKSLEAIKTKLESMGLELDTWPREPRKKSHKWFDLDAGELEYDVRYRISDGPSKGIYRIGNMIECARLFVPTFQTFAKYMNVYSSDGGRLLIRLNIGSLPRRIHRLRFARNPPNDAEVQQAKKTLAEHKSYMRARAKRKIT